MVEAEYEDGPYQLRGPCTPKTRAAILSLLMAWATDDTNSQVFFLNGLAGTGKTTISYSFCELLEEAGLLGASYFFSRTVDKSVIVRNVLPTISYQLVSSSMAAKDALRSSLERNDNIGSRNVERQFEELIRVPASKLGLPKRRVIVCDGWDEAEDRAEICKLITLLLKHSSHIPIKIFISSRPDPDIMETFNEEGSFTTRSSLLLHDIERHIVERDIRLYMEGQLEQMDKKGWISPERIGILVQQAGKLFVYASAVCTYLLGCKGAEETADRLKSIINPSHPKANDGSHVQPYSKLDVLYAQILTNAFQEREEDVKSVLSLVISASYPLVINHGISTLLEVKEYRVDNAVSCLQSVLTHSDQQPVAIFHTSFREYLLSDSRSGDKHLDIHQCHWLMLRCCLKVMQAELIKDNICNLDHKDISQDSVAKEKISGIISPALTYACTSWLSHLLELKQEQLADPEVRNLLIGIFDQYILRWIECMSLLGRLDDAVKLLRRMELFENVSHI